MEMAQQRQFKYTETFFIKIIVKTGTGIQKQNKFIREEKGKQIMLSLNKVRTYRPQLRQAYKPIFHGILLKSQFPSQKNFYFSIEIQLKYKHYSKGIQTMRTEQTTHLLIEKSFFCLIFIFLQKQCFYPFLNTIKTDKCSICIINQHSNTGMEESNFNLSSYFKDLSKNDDRSFINEARLDLISPSLLHNPRLSKRDQRYRQSKNISNILSKQKVAKITKSFARKLRYNSISRVPPDFLNQEETLNSDNKKISICITFMRKIFSNLFEWNGLQLSTPSIIAWSLITLIQTYIVVIASCITMTFDVGQANKTFSSLKICSIVLSFLDLFLNLSVRRYESGKYLIKVGEISKHYATCGVFLVDLVCILAMVMEVAVVEDNSFSIVVVLATMAKLLISSKKFEKFEYLLINNSAKQQYLGLFKVILTNITIGHFLSIILNLMALADQNNNWYYKVGIQDSSWHSKYIWGYYWGTNIMLTVGFGDISAVTEIEALVLIFIETFTCITLAYNINTVGSLITLIKKGEDEKNDKLKVLHRMCKQNFINNNTEAKIANFIEVEYRINEKFEQDKHNDLLKYLPEKLQTEFRKEANKALFDDLGFLKNFLSKSLNKLAEVIERKICHPDELIIPKNSAEPFMILQKGCLVQVCQNNSQLDGKVIERIQVAEGEKPRIVSLNWIKNKAPVYDTKSVGYTIIYQLSQDRVLDVLRDFKGNYQVFCQLKDKDESELDENNLYRCQVCQNEHHSKFECNRIHFIPLKRHVIANYLHKVKKSKQKRQQARFRNKSVYKTLRDCQKISINQRQYLQDNVNSEQYIKIQRVAKFYGSINQDNNFICFSGRNKVSQILLKTDKVRVQGLTYKKIEKFIEGTLKRNEENHQLQSDSAHNFSFYFHECNVDKITGRKIVKRGQVSALLCKSPS